MSVELLKIIAMLTMLLDHLGAVGFFGGSTNLVMRYIGRISFPIFAYLLATGFRHTKNKEKHIIGLGFFAALSEVPFDLVHGAFYYPQSQNVLWTFFFASVSMYAVHKARDFLTVFLAFSTGVLCYVAVYFFNTDYSIYGFSLVLIIYIFENCVALEKCRENIQKKTPEPCWHREKDYIESSVILLMNLFLVFCFTNYSMISLPVTLFGLTFSAQLFGILAFFSNFSLYYNRTTKKTNGEDRKNI